MKYQNNITDFKPELDLPPLPLWERAGERGSSFSTRRGLTLVELLVVISIIGLLGGIIGLIAPRFAERSRVAQGSSQLRSWLLVAKQRAMRDKAPRGLRILDQSSELKNFAYIEQPEDITGMPTDPVPDPVYQDAISKFGSTYTDLVMTNPSGRHRLMWLPTRNLRGVVQAGDIVEYGAARYRVMAVETPSSQPSSSYFVLHRHRDESRDNGTALPPYRITRTARLIAGEPTMTLPKNIAVDLNRCVTGSSVGGGGGVFDITFGPSGEVIGSAGQTGRIILWLRDVTLNAPTDVTNMPPPDGENRLLVIHTRTGQVTAHSVCTELDPTTGKPDWYRFVRDGKSSALEE